MEEINKEEGIMNCIFKSQYHMMLDKETQDRIKEKTKEEEIKYQELRKKLEKLINNREDIRAILDIVLEYKNILREESCIKNKRYYEVGFSSAIKLILDCYKTL